MQKCTFSGKDVEVYENVAKHLAPLSYSTVTTVDLWEMRLMVLAKRKHRQKVSHVEVRFFVYICWWVALR